jgi:hypothetical protein
MGGTIMSEFSELFLELRTILDDPESFDSRIGAWLEPDLVDKLSAYAAARNESLPEAVLAALQLFMFSAAEDAWRELAGGKERTENFSAAPLNIILERFMNIALDPSRQRVIEGPAPAILNQFCRIRED